MKLNEKEIKMIRLQQQYITDGENQAVVSYTYHEHFAGRKAVIMSAKAESDSFYKVARKIIGTDEKGDYNSFLCYRAIIIYENNPLYTRAVEMASK